MSQSGFASIFRSSAFASLTPPALTANSGHLVHTSQALCASAADRQAGNWGLKSSVPYNPELSPKYITVDQHDDPLTKATKYKSAAQPVYALKRWAELMPPPAALPPARAQALASFALDSGAVKDLHEIAASPAKPRAEFTRPREAETISAEEWRETVRFARAKRAEYAALPPLGKPTWDTVLNVEAVPESATTRPVARFGVAVHPPSYAIVPESDEPTIVKARVLNGMVFRSQNMKRYAVGVAGIVAYAPNLTTNTDGFRSQLLDVRVSHAEFDYKARPHVIVDTNATLRDMRGALGFTFPENSSFSERFKKEAGATTDSARSSSSKSSSDSAPDSDIVNILRSWPSIKNDPPR
ncbi:hypothetical protein BDZ88DRAFT_510877 [Geranomyces variabilis]|nr:hypothetical protein BDZ88DRAFT_510877 [Geranomyces variabilis]KAJ3131172.1 hypothetical protein HDU90_008683 [Geranomyces variabilis]